MQSAGKYVLKTTRWFLFMILCVAKKARPEQILPICSWRVRGIFAGLRPNPQNCYKNEHSEIFVQARSAPKGKIPVYGGYIWANQGFDFRDKSDLPRFRDRFKSFLSAHGVEITDKDLKRFTKPCHFAAFGCGIQVADDNGNGVHLGKAFMLEQTWFGRWSTENPRAEEKRYAEAYNREGIPHASRRRQAVAVLNENYKNILRQIL